MGSINRNSLCPCGSGKKYKQCCMGSAEKITTIASDPKSFEWEKPSKGRDQDQQIDLFIIQGHGSRNKLDYAAACDVWGRAWDQFLLRLGLGMTTFDKSLPAYDGSFYLKNWTQDYCATLNNAALTDAAAAKVGASFCQGILLQFSDEDSHFLNNFKASLGEFHYLAAEAQEGEKILTDLINDYPQLAIGYAYLADMLGSAQYNPNADAPFDLDRAINLLEKALAYPVEDARAYDLEERLNRFHTARS